MIRKFFGLIFNPWLLLALGLLALSLVIWIVGPLVSIGTWRPLVGAGARWGLIAAIVLLVVLRKAWQMWRARATNERVVDKLLTPVPGDGTSGALDAEVKVLGERFATALQTLRRTKFDQGGGSVLSGWWSGLTSRAGKRYLYELPWYLIIGAPGSGKTQALLNSGLKFPLAGTLGGEQAVRGVGGTRNCDWWFTDQAVLIDTAGRYTTQDSDQARDSRAWDGFLGLLKQSRPRQPINGVLLTVSVTDLLTRGPAERAQHAETVRKRLQELHAHWASASPSTCWSPSATCWRVSWTPWATSTRSCAPAPGA